MAPFRAQKVDAAAPVRHGLCNEMKKGRSVPYRGCCFGHVYLEWGHSLGLLPTGVARSFLDN
ncbi:hypothetical protein L1049_011425 [Liquidambar formosana]|uniref:Uncharacterized protein n=1 Tax=Liquidambar formosana TaxID=63359 RepID=A0AAP0RX04_LIQFO